MSLRLHKEHGVNPSVGICFWCGEADTVLLLGHNRGKKAPREMVINYDPCPKCLEGMAMGVTLIEAVDHPTQTGQMPIQKTPSYSLYPTGRWFVVTEDFVRRTFDQEMAEASVKHRKAFIDREAVDKLGIVEAEPVHKL